MSMSGKNGSNKLARRFSVHNGHDFSLAACPTRAAEACGLDKKTGKRLLKERIRDLSRLQALLYANGTWSVLVVLQALDAGGKDGVIKHVMSGINPQGVSVTSFKQPGPVELSHGYLWREHLAAPAAGRIGIFNRSHYEEVLVTRVHPELLEHECLPPTLRHKPTFWEDRYHDINHFERYLARQGTVVLKFFLHLSREEQRKRFLRRIEHRTKNWKFSPADIHERQYWDDYQHAYEEAIRRTAHPDAPWFIVPADQKWFERLVVIEAIIDALEKLHLKMPASDPAMEQEMEKARRQLEAEAPKAGSRAVH
ncbi:polyphosphate--nucleotide phosphotransferase [Komagataeibacter xylinus]|uniref:Polyphosphate kinase 2 family protein n=2 Tax=Komagataeibacter rhaeticus TaxID=215221 RepID=A0A858JMY3_9PROT|nr:polyphosphate kinase 2 family protein [Komagataeibacter rhaeticus]ATU71854.1 polyphosphate--nucleotide phosphotransferase [Komagataeibacter xylinus]QIP37074.1 polyphosphate kinase 2 family protein [Komagataeibacter rhaeticus]QOC48217.1 polyphosphate kinase 2 family protein [Komagataeibacter rhaeticus]WPP23564.1 polyphosphate kinase 2 family protein [Komagataeibacter rhaeticus]